MTRFIKKDELLLRDFRKFRQKACNALPKLLVSEKVDEENIVNLNDGIKKLMFEFTSDCGTNFDGSFSFTHSLTLSLSHTHTRTHIGTHTHSLSHTLTHIYSLSLSHTPSQTHTITHNSLCPMSTFGLNYNHSKVVGLGSELIHELSA